MHTWQEPVRFKRGLAGGALLAVLLGTAEAGAGAEPAVKMEWEFRQPAGWAGWIPNEGIRDVQFGPEAAAFRSTGGDPQILSPPFEMTNATNLQWVQIDLDCEVPGEGELFYTNKTTGIYGGLEPEWMTRFMVPSAGRQTVLAWPFWGGLGKIIRLRFDPPDGMSMPHPHARNHVHRHAGAGELHFGSEIDAVFRLGAPPRIEQARAQRIYRGRAGKTHLAQTISRLAGRRSRSDERQE